MSLADHVTVRVAAPTESRVLRPHLQIAPTDRPDPSRLGQIERLTRDLAFRADDFPVSGITLCVARHTFAWILSALPLDRSGRGGRVPIAYHGGARSFDEMDRLAAGPRAFLTHAFRETLRGWLLHEIDECLMDGQGRPYDPHAGKRPLPPLQEQMVRGEFVR